VAKGQTGRHILVFGLQVSLKERKKRKNKLIVSTEMVIELFATGCSHA